MNFYLIKSQLGHAMMGQEDFRFYYLIVPTSKFTKEKTYLQMNCLDMTKNSMQR